MNILICLILAPLPSLIWLVFYLRKDRHPEPNKMVIKVFLLGVLSVPIAWLLEFGASLISEKLEIINKLFFIIIGFALIEEILKYLVIRFWVLKSPDFDEAVDAMIYMIISALGFAAAENIYLLSQMQPAILPLQSAIEFSMSRFLGATFLHALASGIAGYFLAASLIVKSSIRKTLIGGGLLAATILHSVFNYIIILNINGTIDSMVRNFYLVILLLTMAVIISFMFKKIKKYRSICNL